MWSNNFLFFIFLLWPWSKVLTKRGELGMFFAGGTTYTLNGIGNNNVCRLSSFFDWEHSWWLGVVFGRCGGDNPWLGGSDGLPLVWSIVVTLHMAVFCIQSAPPSLDVGTFSRFWIHLALVVLALCLIGIGMFIQPSSPHIFNMPQVLHWPRLFWHCVVVQTYLEGELLILDRHISQKKMV